MLRPIILQTALLTGLGDVGETLTGAPYLTISEGDFGIESRAYQWYCYPSTGGNFATRTAISNATAADYVVTEDDQDCILLLGETVTDSRGISDEAFTEVFEIEGQSVLDGFSGIDGTLPTAHQTDTGETWNVVSGGSIVPVLSNGRLSPSTTSGGGEYYAISSASQSDIAVSVDVDTATSGSAIGVLARVTGSGSTFSAYYGRLNRASKVI